VDDPARRRRAELVTLQYVVCSPDLEQPQTRHQPY
jgi:hypothetical protein